MGRAHGQAFNANGELVEQLVIMPNHARCAVEFCDNDKKYPDLAYVRSHVVNFMNHKWPADPKLDEIWRKQVAKTTGGVFNPSPAASRTFACSKPFSTGKKKKSSPKMRKANKLQQANSPRCLLPNVRTRWGR